MSEQTLTRAHEAEITRLLDAYHQNQKLLSGFLQQVQIFLATEKLIPLVHSTKARLKDPEHLRKKLARKYLAALQAGEDVSIDCANLFQKVTDLVGVRLLHLHTRQLERIHPSILEAFEEARTPLVEAPFARTWDDESRGFFKSLGLETQSSPSLYTSVHYVIQSNSKTIFTAEIQVRTLAEELWGEVDHAMNYPEQCQVAACREQIKVLARVTSSCTRLVDSIFDAHAAASPPPSGVEKPSKKAERPGE